MFGIQRSDFVSNTDIGMAFARLSSDWQALHSDWQELQHAFQETLDAFVHDIHCWKEFLKAEYATGTKIARMVYGLLAWIAFPVVWILQQPLWVFVVSPNVIVLMVMTSILAAYFTLRLVSRMDRADVLGAQRARAWIDEITRSIFVWVEERKTQVSGSCFFLPCSIKSAD